MITVPDESELTILQIFVSTFQSRTPQASVYIHGLLQSLIENQMRSEGTMSVKQFLFADLGEIVLPAHLLIDPANDLVEAPHDPRFQISRKLEVFITRAGEVGRVSSAQVVWLITPSFILTYSERSA